MEQKELTIVISPRDRFSGLRECIEGLYEHTDESLFELIVLDLGYPDKELARAKQLIAQKTNAKLISYGLIIPMEGMSRVRDEVHTPYTFFLDNDSRVSPGWLEPLMETAKSTGAAVVSPLILETEGVDGDYVRNHLYTVEIRSVDIDGKTYLIEHKTHRRALQEDIPTETTPTQAFELHGVLFRSDALMDIELPRMTIREHLDIGMQLRAKDEKLLAEPKSIIYFDNLGTRAEFRDLQFFNLRWNRRIGKYSHDLFEKRWGYNWYSEDAVYNWCSRRRVYLLLRWAYVPNGLANLVDRVFGAIRRRLFPIWDPLDNPLEESTLLYEKFADGKPRQLSKAVEL